MEKSTFGKRMGTIMQERGMSRAALNDATGISLQSISNYLNDRRKPDCELIAEIAKALNVSADYLLELSDIPTRNETIQGVHDLTGLWQDAIFTLNYDKQFGDSEISEFISYLITDKHLPRLISAVKQKNSFSEGTICNVDINGEDHETDMRSLFKLIINDLFWEIIDGYTVKPEEIMVGRREGENDG